MISVSSNRVVVFSKSADRGGVKTRMRPVLNEDECLALHLALLNDTLEKTKAMDRVLYLSGSGYLPMNIDFPVRMQVGPDLGSRMFRAFQKELRNASKVVIIGTDSPTFRAELINTAFHQLDQFDAVFGPAEDGGYYLIGLSTLIPEIFRNVEWGGAHVLQDTLKKIGTHRFTLLETCFDVDTPSDLRRLEELLPEFPQLVNLNEWLQARNLRIAAGS